MGKSLGRRNHRCTRAFGKAVLFSIFFCGCKLPKSFHIGLSAAKVRISSRTCASGPYFFRLFRNAGPRMEETCRGRGGPYARIATSGCPPVVPVRTRGPCVPTFLRETRWDGSFLVRPPLRPGTDSFPPGRGVLSVVGRRGGGGADMEKPAAVGLRGLSAGGLKFALYRKKETKMLIVPGAACLHTRRRP